MTFDNIAIMIATNDRGMSAILDFIDPGLDPGFWKRPALVPAVPVPSGPP